MCGQTNTNTATQTQTDDKPTIQSFPYSGVPTASGLRALGAQTDPATIHVGSDHSIFISAPSIPGFGAAANTKPELYLLGNAPQGVVGLSMTDLQVSSSTAGSNKLSLKLGVLDANGALRGGAPISLEYHITPDAVLLSSAGTPANLAAAPSVLCLVKCAGVQLIPAIMGCLPSLVGGPAAFMSCLVGTAGPTVAGIATCVAGCF
jgi:hypothetical protein